MFTTIRWTFVLMAALSLTCGMWACSKTEETPPEKPKVVKPRERAKAQETKPALPYAVSLADLRRLYPPIPEKESAVAAIMEADKTYEALADAASDKKLPVIGLLEKPIKTNSYSPTALSLMGIWMANHEALLARYENIARHKRGGWVRVPDAKHGIATDHRKCFRHGVQALALLALMRTEMGLLDDAATALEAGLLLSEKPCHEPSLGAHLVAVACASEIVAPQMEWTLTAGSLSEASLKKLDSALAALEPRLSDQEIIAGDQIFLMLPLRALADDPEKLNAYNKRHGIEMDMDYVKAELARYPEYRDGFVRAAGRRERKCLKALEEVVKGYPEPVNFARRARAVLAGKAQPVIKIDKPGVLVTQYMAAQLGDVRALLRYRAHLRCIRVALAIEGYRLQYKKLPERLENLMPTFMRRMPRDPLTGNPIRYKPYEGVGYWVYTVKDEPKIKGEEEEETEDVVFEVLRWGENDK